MKISARVRSDLLLVFVAAVWGSGFIAQRVAAERMSAFTFNAGRFLLASLALGAFVLISARFSRRAAPDDDSLRFPPARHLPGIGLAGFLLFAAAGLQQAGLETTSVGNASFITGMYVVLVPVVLFIFGGERIHWLSWGAVALAAGGAALLSLTDGFKLAPGDALELAGALLWALHVIQVGRLARRGVNALWFAVLQFFVCGALNLLTALILQPDGVSSLVLAIPAVIYSALIPIGLGFTLQLVGQRHAPTVDAAVIFSTEAVFGTLAAFLLLGEGLSVRQLFGCGLIMAGMLLSQVRPAAGRDTLAVVSQSD